MIRVAYPGSRIQIFSIPDPDPGAKGQKELVSEPDFY
jgi:hypothetical protein